MVSRRQFISKAAAVPGILYSPHWIDDLSRSVPQVSPATDVTEDEDYWYQIKMAYTVSPTLINLNNGGVCPQPRVVQEAVERYNKLSNESPSYYMWRILDKGREVIREKLADLAGCNMEEVALQRNASEALEAVIFGLPLQAGDEVVLTKQDYPNMINAWKQRAHRDGIVLKWLDFQFPIEDEQMIVDEFANAFSDKTKLVHVTHVINWIGQILPVAKIADAAHRQNIEVLIDGAHSFAHLVYDIPSLGGDYFGTSLHKWLCAPFGTGMLWVKKEKVSKIYPLFAAPEPTSDNIRKFENLGTRPFANEQAIGEAIDFHQMIGRERKFKRLHYLRNYWVEKLEGMEKVHIHTSKDPRFAGAIGFFSMEGATPNEVSSILLNKHHIHTVAINWENIHGIRISPNVYTVLKDLDRFVTAVASVAKA